jgi:hypothetical protein
MNWRAFSSGPFSQNWKFGHRELFRFAYDQLIGLEETFFAITSIKYLPS